ncbi:hypothetical protein L1987_04528 [Smallanthus sonchifolius]|uniref:Uncharacterized protein n=1 Tax=Smallanthus sonchifolius TaxID=185202 RepID=A0ACB9JSU0_9ASTR|nr:hypothetical protein L1987_04528 [Smallanthus sonchifolius]
MDPLYQKAPNKNKKSPKMVFMEEHSDLLNEAQQWMKDVSASCTVVAALIITMAFAGAFTLPGGNEDNGNPLFLNRATFMLFIISDAIALFSSTASVVMFLGILTARFAADDFLYALPKRMTIGLVFLFMSLAATMIAFSATLAIVLKDKVSWIADCRIERGNQREKDRERAQSRNGGKSKNKDDGLTPEQRRERDGKALQEKAAKKAAQAEASGGNGGGNKSTKK